MENRSWVTSMSVWLAFSTTLFLLGARVSLLWLLRLYKYEQIHPVTWYIIILVLIGVPQISNFIYILWNTPIISAANRERLPKVSHIAMGVIASILEGVACAIFATEVAHTLPEPVIITLPYATLTFVVLKHVCKHLKKPQLKLDSKCWPRVRRVVCKSVQVLSVGYMFCVVGVVGGVLSGWSTFSLTPMACVILVVTIPILGVVWYPAVQRLTQTSSTSGRRCPTVDLIYVPVKVISVGLALFLSIFFKLEDFRNFPGASLVFGMVEFTEVKIWFPVTFCCVSGGLGLLNVMASTKVGLTTPGMKIPMFLCPPLSVAMTAILWDDFETDAFWEVTGSGVYAWTAIALSSVTWLIPFLLPSFGGFKSHILTRRDLKNDTFSFSWSSFFLEPKLISVNMKEELRSQSKEEMAHENSSSGQRKTIFICTTMYKESESEMLRYLTSIKHVFENSDEKEVKVEAHVFFDSSVRVGRINTRGRHLLALLCQIFQLNISELEKLATPYGCQIHTKHLLNHPVYIHFKDAVNVKAKKRWSQVMYMHYVLQFRNHATLPSRVKDGGVHGQDNNDNGGRESDNQRKAADRLSLIDSLYQPSCSSDSSTRPASPHSYCQIYSLPVRAPIPIRGGYSHHFTSPVPRTELSSPSGILAALATHMTPCTWGSALATHTTPCTWGSDETFHLMVDKHLSSWQSSMSLGSDKEGGSTSGGTVTSWSSSNYSMTERPLSKVTSLDDVYLLTTDADTAFDAQSLSHVLEQCESEPNIGAVCGRTIPIGAPKPIVWYQKFEYAKDFWLVKSSQNVIGSVTCCPGCFSIYRGAAMATVASEFSKPADSAFDSLVMDHGEDRWLCTLLMQRGWRLGYSCPAQNSTHCPETVGEFLRQRRRWVLSELSNMAAIFQSVPELVRNNSSFSAMFLLSLLTTFLWVILSPATTIVFLCAGLDLLFNMPLTLTLPVAVGVFLLYCLVCCVASQGKQKMISIALTSVMAVTVLSLSVGFILYVVNAIQRDVQDYGYGQFRPYCLVFLLIAVIVYAALLHPSESSSLVYGLPYALLFPAMFVMLPVYALGNMLDQSWGTREAGTRSCCQVPEVEDDEDDFNEFSVDTKSLQDLSATPGGEREDMFWKTLQSTVIGNDVNNGKSGDVLSDDLSRLHRVAMSWFIFANLLWFLVLGVLYTVAGSDVICYCVAAIFSFSLMVQLVGLTCYKFNILVERHLKDKTKDKRWSL
ncbi:unnamed protein product [Lymnaea stagnalis]|uniref:chitin synthase n=1 Tax=Lymnaea stagnalis TaxID=6523 RepID=A0AAV2HVY5_LYMST